MVDTELDFNGLWPRYSGTLSDSYRPDDLRPDAILHAKEFISEFIKPQEKINRKTTSYGLKHEYEYLIKYIWKVEWGEYDQYLSNGEFIQAMIESGYEYIRTEPMSINAYFNAH